MCEISFVLKIYFQQKEGEDFMKSLLSLLLVSVAASACINLNGQLDIKQTLTAKTKSGFLNLSRKTTQFQSGIYDAELKIIGEKKFKLSIKERGTDKNEISLPFKSQDDLNIPSNGFFTISGNQVGQNFDIQGTIATEFSRSESERTIEACTISRVVKKCVEVQSLANASRPERPEHGGQPGQPGTGPRPVPQPQPKIECHDETISIPGEHEVISHMSYTSRDISAQFVEPTSKGILAELSTSGTESSRVVEHEDPCRPDHHGDNHDHF